MSDANRLSSYLDFLPAIYREPTGGARPDFLGRFLLAFEKVLSGLGDAQSPGLEEILEGIVDPASGNLKLAGVHRFFDPGPGRPDAERAPSEFLGWLSGWVALTLRGDWSDEERRRTLAGVVPAYRRRGTKEGLRQLLSAYTGMVAQSITISEFESPFWVGPIHNVWTPVGGDAALGGGPPHYFLVSALITAADAADLERKRGILHAIIDVEKPAHTYYDLHLQVPTMQIGVHSTIGLDTLLGDPVQAQ
ncbi:MAG TPA: phage tail protein [Thermoanaerobaculia bacterium]|nr:phage tail protein [Thermoanaerobaculia bacterium]